ncbi:MAG: hypothetical protein CBARDMAM_5586 [uncultured Caballeronia sp.]|nr:MAG: hypothetical protein CBARDMAM_5586 [uncultured Caballeronia sp.]
MDNKKASRRMPKTISVNLGRFTSVCKKPLTKIERVLHALRSDPRGLNLFEAEHIGEHVLRTTISALTREG